MSLYVQKYTEELCKHKDRKKLAYFVTKNLNDATFQPANYISERRIDSIKNTQTCFYTYERNVLWNCMPDEVKESRSLDVFKSNYRFVIG